MFVGHFGIAQLGKATRREIPFTWLVVAAYLPDLVRVPLTPLTHASRAPVALAPGRARRLPLRLPRSGCYAAGNLVGGRGTSRSPVCCIGPLTSSPVASRRPFTAHGSVSISYRRPVNDLLLEGVLLVGGWFAARRRGFAIGMKWLVVGFAVQLGFLRVDVLADRSSSSAIANGCGSRRCRSCPKRTC